MCFVEPAPVFADKFAQILILAWPGSIGCDDRFGSFSHALSFPLERGDYKQGLPQTTKC